MINNFKQIKPRSMHRVLSDIEFLIANDISTEIILTDIAQLKRQLLTVEEMVTENKNNKEIYQVINPSIKCYENN